MRRRVTSLPWWLSTGGPPLRRRSRASANVAALVILTFGAACSAQTVPIPGPVRAGPTSVAASLTRTSASGIVSTATATPDPGTGTGTLAAPTPSPADLPAVGPSIQAAPDSRSAPASAFTSSISEISELLAVRMQPSWRPGCPPLSDLRYVQVTHLGFDGVARVGELVVSARVADDVVAVFGTLYAAGFPIESMRLVDDFGGDDTASMAANNTSAFNCRAATGGTSVSEHATGEAIDLNPRQNPYVSGGVVLPPDGAAFLDRTPRPGVIVAEGPVVAAFAGIGWAWGGDWTDPVDFQHFSRSGR